MIEVRLATPTDATGILSIYTPYILSDHATFETKIPSLAEFRDRIQQYSEKFPWIVCLINNKIAGYVYASPFKAREAYQWSAECSVYIADNFKNKGIGKCLYNLLFPILKLQGIRSLYAGVTLPNIPSVKLHEGLNFKSVCEYENIGYKLGRWHNVGWWKLQLNDYDAEPPPFIEFTQMDHTQFIAAFNKTAECIQSRL